MATPSYTNVVNFTKTIMVYPNLEITKERFNKQNNNYPTTKGEGKKKPAHRENFKASLASGRTHAREEMKVYDIRSVPNDFDIDTHGFIFTNFKTKMSQTKEVMLDPEEKEIRSVYWPEMEKLAKDVVVSQGRKPKYAYALATQKFLPDEAARKKAAQENPFGAIAATYSRIAHADFSEVVFDNAYKMLTKRGVSEDEAKNKLDLMLVNVWKPYNQTVKDNPFAILDWTSVNPKEDVHVYLRGRKIVKGGLYTSSVTYNPSHRWVYLDEQRDDEIWFFKQADSRAYNKEPAHIAQYGFHQSFKLPNDKGKAFKTRSSIALRLLLAYEKDDTRNTSKL